MNFENLFESFNTQDSYAILFFMLIAFLFGLLTGYLLRGRKIRRLKKELKVTKKKLTEKETEAEALNEQLKLKEVDLKKAIYDKEEEETRAARLEMEKSKLYNDLLQANSELEKLLADNKSYISTIEDLNSRINKMETKEGVSISEKTLAAGIGDVEKVYKKTEDRLTAFEEKLSRLDSENRQLKSELEGLKLATDRSVPHSPEDMEELVIRSDKSVLKEKIVVDIKEKDDLTQIEGLGPFLEHKLNAEGIFTYKQLAALSASDVVQLTEKIGYIPGRIEKDDWLGQAAGLAKAKKEDPKAFEVKTKSPAESEDLKIIEGIGPKIEQIFKEAGIANIRALAETSAEELEKILEAAGSRFSRHNPSTWPTQARLAVNEEWKLLKEYQNELKGGREV